jgi:hypothetical protein
MTGSTTWFRGAPKPGTLISKLRRHREVPMRRKGLARSLLDAIKQMARASDLDW